MTYGGVFQVAGLADEDGPLVMMPDYSSSPNVQTCTKSSCYPNDDPVQSYTSKGINNGFGYAFYLADTTNYLNRCFASTKALNVIENEVGIPDVSEIDGVSDVTGFLSDVYADLFAARDYIFGFGFGVSVVR